MCCTVVEWFKGRCMLSCEIEGKQQRLVQSRDVLSNESMQMMKQDFLWGACLCVCQCSAVAF